MLFHLAGTKQHPVLLSYYFLVSHIFTYGIMAPVSMHHACKCTEAHHREMHEFLSLFCFFPLRCFLIKADFNEVERRRWAASPPATLFPPGSLASRWQQTGIPEDLNGALHSWFNHPFGEAEEKQERENCMPNMDKWIGVLSACAHLFLCVWLHVSWST